jgi:probable F420-dependent oxidoreductase
MQVGVATFSTDEGIGPADLGRALEERAFDSLLVTEHSHIPAGRETPYAGGGDLPWVYYRTLEPFIALTAAAVVTTRLLLATGVALVPQRDVIHTAKQVASLDLVSGGRFLFGVGWNIEEMRSHGTDPARRGRRLDESLAAMKRIWTEERAEFHGEHVDFEPMFSWPKPVQRPHPPIYVGGGSKAALRRVVEPGDGWLALGASPDVVAQTRKHFADQGRDDVTVVFFGCPPKAEAGVDHLTLMLPTLPKDATLSTLDRYAELAARYDRSAGAGAAAERDL